MSPRPYRMEKRRVAATATRARILEATRQLLAEQGTSDLSMDAIARRADVARLTIYYQFKSRRGLLEALYDHLAIRGNMQRMAEGFDTSNPARALEQPVPTFVRVWSSDPLLMRRPRALAPLDAEVEKGIRARDDRRRRAAREILGRMTAGRQSSKARAAETAAADVIAALTSFEMYDALTKTGHRQEAIVTLINRLAQLAVTP